MNADETPLALFEGVGADFQDGEAVWFWPVEQTDGFIDVMVYHAEQRRAAFYTWEQSTDTVTTYMHNLAYVQ